MKKKEQKPRPVNPGDPPNPGGGGKKKPKPGKK